MFGNRFDRALVYAHQLHCNQTRKGTPTPYISHLLAVASLVIEAGGNEDQAIAGLLHDAAEDQGGRSALDEIERQFGGDVAAIVADCTDAWTEPKPPWRERKEAYVTALPRKSERSLLVSLADKTHNAECILWDYRTLGDKLWERFAGGKEGTIWYYNCLGNIFLDMYPGNLANRLVRAAVEFSK